MEALITTYTVFPLGQFPQRGFATERLAEEWAKDHLADTGVAFTIRPAVQVSSTFLSEVAAKFAAAPCHADVADLAKVCREVWGQLATSDEMAARAFRASYTTAAACRLQRLDAALLEQA